MRIFLDCNVLFDTIDPKNKRRFYTTLNHAKNLDHMLVTSLTVIGEMSRVCFRDNRREDLTRILDLMGELDIKFLLPNSDLRKCCICLDECDKNNRVDFCDRTHLAYSTAYDDDYFLTSDDNLLHFPLSKCDCESRCGKIHNSNNKIIHPKDLKTILKKI